MKKEFLQANPTILIEEKKGIVSEVALKSFSQNLEKWMDSVGPDHAHDFDHGGVGHDHGNEHGNQANEHTGEHGYGNDAHGLTSALREYLEITKIQKSNNGSVPSPNDSFETLLAHKKLL
jgi:hypothetical protein